MKIVGMPSYEHAPEIDTEVINHGTNIVVAAPVTGPAAAAGCVQLLEAVGSRPNVLYVTLVQSPDARLETWRSHAVGEPATVGFVVVDETPRSSTTTAARAAPGNMNALGAVETVAAPRDLTGIGIAIQTFLDMWEADDTPAVLCFHSLTALLQHVALRRAFRFLHMLTRRLAACGVIAHYHIDPGAHDPQALHTLYTLFDSVLVWEAPGTRDNDESTARGAWTVQ